MKQVLIAKNLAYAAKASGGTAADPSELAVGALGVFTPKGVLMTAANAAATEPDLKEFIIAVGAIGGPVLTPPLQREGVYSVRAAEYEAPVKQVATVTLTDIVFVNNDGTTVTTATYQHAGRGDEAIVRVINKTTGAIRQDIQSYSANVKPGDTASTLAARLAANINLDGDRLVDATVNAAVITLTAKAFGTNVALAIDGVASQGGSFAYTTPFGVGSGTSDQVGDQERLSQASTKNVFEQAGGRGATPVTLNAVDGAKYDLMFIDAINRHHQKDGMDATYGRFIPIMIAFEDGAGAAEGVLSGLLGSLINYTGAAISPEPALDAPDAA
jgi:hypothetical protein